MREAIAINTYSDFNISDYPCLRPSYKVKLSNVEESAGMDSHPSIYKLLVDIINHDMTWIVSSRDLIAYAIPSPKLQTVRSPITLPRILTWSEFCQGDFLLLSNLSK